MDRPVAIADLRYLAFGLMQLNRLYGAIEAANNLPLSQRHLGLALAASAAGSTTPIPFNSP
jgi:hypothetical protein